MELPLVSILIPVYNSEKTIKRCMDSVFLQTYPNIELLICDGYSNDRSIEIIKNYKAGNNYRLLYSKKGVGIQRNKLINESKGDFLFFLDSDDFIDENCISLLVEKSIETSSDIVVPSYYYKNKEGVVPRIFENQSCLFDVNALLNYMTPSLHKLYYKQFIQDFRFNDSISYGEDWIYNFNLSFKNGKVSIISIPLYYYQLSELTEFEKYGPYKSIKLLYFMFSRRKKVYRMQLANKEIFNKFLYDRLIGTINCCMDHRYFYCLILMIPIRCCFIWKKDLFVLFPILIRLIKYIRHRI